jgi:signal transduction histidine kinase
MKLSAFLRDRAPYIAVYAAFGLLTVTVVQLDLALSQASLRFTNLLYIWLLGMVGMLLFLLFDYQRQAGFLRRLGRPDPDQPLDDLVLLPEPRTLEQRAFAEAWSALYGRLRAELVAERERGRRRIEFLSQWAHHMKTPVAVIDLELQKARKLPVEPEVAAILTSLEEENRRIGHSLQALLNLIRLEDFAADFRVEPVDLVALVRGLINEQKRAFIAHRVYPRLEVDEEAPAGAFTVQSDAKWLRFVLEQLVSNAIKYASRPDRDGQVAFRIRRAGEETVLEVADNGIGIPPEDLGRVFAPFYTGANGRRSPHATGLGLYLAREACLRLGHRIHLESRQGEGTRVFVRFATSPTTFSGLAPTLSER